MAIEFRCTGCQKLLRTSDETAGKQARCPQCGMVVPIPLPAADDEPPLSVPPEVAGTWADPSSWQASAAPNRQGAFGSPENPWNNPANPAIGGANPYQSPTPTASFAGATSKPGRHGPAWERSGPSPGSYVETFQECFTDIPEFFATMRRDGGIAAPLGFAFIGIVIAMVANVIYQSLNLGVERLAGNGNVANPLDTAIGLGCVAIGFPIAGVVGLFLAAGIYHMFLVMFDGANAPFEATFRATAYTTGITNLLQIIPCVGMQIGWLATIVLLIIGLANIHETSGWKASGAVLIPLVICCCLTVGLISAVVYVSLQQQGI